MIGLALAASAVISHLHNTPGPRSRPHAQARMLQAGLVGASAETAGLPAWAYRRYTSTSTHTMGSLHLHNHLPPGDLARQCGAAKAPTSHPDSAACRSRTCVCKAFERHRPPAASPRAGGGRRGREGALVRGPCTGRKAKYKATKHSGVHSHAGLIYTQPKEKKRRGLVLCGEGGAGWGHEATCPAAVGAAHTYIRTEMDTVIVYVRISPYGATPCCRPAQQERCCSARSSRRAEAGAGVGVPGPCLGCLGAGPAMRQGSSHAPRQ